MRGRKSEPYLISLTPWRTYPCKWEAPRTRSFISCQQITGLAVKFMASTWEDVKAHGSLEAVFGCDRHQTIQSQVRWSLQYPPAPPLPTLRLRQASLRFPGFQRSSQSVCREAAHGAGRQSSKLSQDPRSNPRRLDFLPEVSGLRDHGELIWGDGSW